MLESEATTCWILGSDAAEGVSGIDREENSYGDLRSEVHLSMQGQMTAHGFVSLRARSGWP